MTTRGLYIGSDDRVNHYRVNRLPTPELLDVALLNAMDLGGGSWDIADNIKQELQRRDLISHMRQLLAMCAGIPNN